MSPKLVKKIGLMAGAFDPIHSGHLALAEAAARNRQLDEVWLIADPGQPLRKSPLSSLVHRLAMMDLAVAGSAKVSVYRGEFENSPHNMNTFSSLMDRNGRNDYVFILGSDSLSHLAAWDDIESVVRLSTFIVTTHGKLGPEVLEKLRSELGVVSRDLKVHWITFSGHMNTSSSSARRLLELGKRPDMLNVDVYNYILQHGLYKD